ncbi:MAG: hypothetical protein NUW37_00160 [Planctomycetes bacterium]|nr:hypothetical protein [Planctomycetota bacterium]
MQNEFDERFDFPVSPPFGSVRDALTFQLHVCKLSGQTVRRIVEMHEDDFPVELNVFDGADGVLASYLIFEKGPSLALVIHKSEFGFYLPRTFFLKDASKIARGLGIETPAASAEIRDDLVKRKSAPQPMNPKSFVTPMKALGAVKDHFLGRGMVIDDLLRFSEFLDMEMLDSPARMLITGCLDRLYLAKFRDGTECVIYLARNESESLVPVEALGKSMREVLADVRIGPEEFAKAVFGDVVSANWDGTIEGAWKVLDEQLPAAIAASLN